MAGRRLALWLSVLLGFLATHSFVLAQSQIFDGNVSTQQSILVLNQERLLRASRTGQEVLAQERMMTEAHRDEGLRLDAELEAEERDLAEKRKELPAEDFAKLAVAFDTKVVATRRDHTEKSELLATTIEDGRKDFFSKIVPIVAQIMRERQADLVFEQRNVLFTGPNVDITADVIERLDNSQPQ